MKALIILVGLVGLTACGADGPPLRPVAEASAE